MDDLASVMVILSRAELEIVIQSLVYCQGRMKHGCGPNWRDYYLVYEPLVGKLRAALPGETPVAADEADG